MFEDWHRKETGAVQPRAGLAENHALRARLLADDPDKGPARAALAEARGHLEKLRHQRTNPEDLYTLAAVLALEAELSGSAGGAGSAPARFSARR